MPIITRASPRCVPVGRTFFFFFSKPADPSCSVAGANVDGYDRLRPSCSRRKKKKSVTTMRRTNDNRMRRNAYPWRGYRIRLMTDRPQSGFHVGRTGIVRDDDDGDDDCLVCVRVLRRNYIREALTRTCWISSTRRHTYNDIIVWRVSVPARRTDVFYRFSQPNRTDISLGYRDL